MVISACQLEWTLAARLPPANDLAGASKDCPRTQHDVGKSADEECQEPYTRPVLAEVLQRIWQFR